MGRIQNFFFFFFAKSVMAPGPKSPNSMHLCQSGDNFSLFFLCKGGDQRQLLSLVESKSHHLKQKKSEGSMSFHSFSFFFS